ncbi:RHS repeat protein, partial [Endozoicomonas sp. SM1973]|nr:RHS repeat protein [Spartinivicinus marinus]
MVNVSKQTVDPFLGVVKTTTDANNLTTTLKYDSFGRLEKEIRPDSTQTEVIRQWCNQSCPAQAIFWVKTQSSGNSPNIVYYDKLGRVVRNESIALTGEKTYIDTVY